MYTHTQAQRREATSNEKENEHNAKNENDRKAATVTAAQHRIPSDVLARSQYRINAVRFLFHVPIHD